MSRTNSNSTVTGSDIRKTHQKRWALLLFDLLPFRNMPHQSRFQIHTVAVMLAVSLFLLALKD